MKWLFLLSFITLLWTEPTTNNKIYVLFYAKNNLNEAHWRYMGSIYSTNQKIVLPVTEGNLFIQGYRLDRSINPTNSYLEPIPLTIIKGG